MANTPSITLAEIAAVGAAVVILYVVPLVLAALDQRRRRRLPVWSSTAAATESPAQLAAADPTIGIPAATPSEVAQYGEPDAVGRDEPVFAAHEDVATAPVAEVSELVAPAAADEYTSDTPEPQMAGAAPCAATEGPAFEPFAGDAGHQFRLEDLHRVRLPDPDATARSDLWREAERVAEAHRAAVFDCELLSPYPIRSACRSGVEQEHSTLRLRYLLFPSLWPVSRDQAVARAMFEIDVETGTVRHRLDVLRRCDLSDDARRAIRDSGGDI
jgi:hypothetical protein